MLSWKKNLENWKVFKQLGSECSRYISELKECCFMKRDKSTLNRKLSLINSYHSSLHFYFTSSLLRLFNFRKIIFFSIRLLNDNRIFLYYHDMNQKMEVMLFENLFSWKKSTRRIEEALRKRYVHQICIFVSSV